VHNKIEHEKHLLRTVVLIKVLVETECITQQLGIVCISAGRNCGTWRQHLNKQCDTLRKGKLRCAIAEAVSRWLSTAMDRVRTQVIWDLWRIKEHLSRFPPSPSISPHSTDCPKLIIYHPGLVQ
jgi:hypothetical protein